MTVAALVTDETQIDTMVSWGQFLARSEAADLTLIVFQKSSGPKEWYEVDGDSTGEKISPLVGKLRDIVDSIRDADTSDPDGKDDGDLENGGLEGHGATESVTISIKVLKDSHPEWTLVDEIESMKIRLLLLPEFSVVKAASESESWRQSLYRRSPCETMQLASQETCGDRPLNVLCDSYGGFG